MITIKEFNEMLSKMRTVKDFDDDAGVEMNHPMTGEGLTVYFSENGVNIRMDTDVITLRRDLYEPYKKGGVMVDP